MTNVDSVKPIANVSVAISTLDRPDILSLCLQTLQAGETLPAEIIVVDQSKDERTRQVVDRFKTSGLNLIYIHHAVRGLGIAQNLALAKARYPVFAVTDDDCVPAPDWVAQLTRISAPGSKVDGIAGRVLAYGQDEASLYPVSTRMSAERVDFDRNAMPWEVGSGNNFAIKREWLLKIGGNDERLGPGSPGRGGVDMDLFYRLLRAGARLRYEPDLVVYHARTTKAGRLSRRGPYGYGMGAGCMLWLRQKDSRAFPILAHWLAMRLRRMARGIWKRDWLLAYEEVLVLWGTFGGLVYGLRVPDRAQESVSTYEKI